MLILSRRINESIIICNGKDKIVITLLQLTGGQTKIGINAPRTVPVHRKEIYERIQEAKQEDLD